MQHSAERLSRFKSALEVLAIVGPIICLVDCVVIPVALMILPLVGLHQIYHGISDQLLTFIVLAICAPGFIPGYLKHRRKRVLALMCIGFICIFFANFAGNAIDQTIHLVITALGSLLLIRANHENKRLSKCGCHSHGIPAEVLVTLNRSPE